ncbi:hypothetical protein QX776_06905 [Alteromonadaceae bacterium BrNp21-10]|nr:hypothetical protein [Alteromonadaceae bacterium BrNp21-10]
MKLLKLLLILIPVVVLSACKTTQPIYNINNHPIVSNIESNEQIKNAIIDAVLYKTWTLKQEKDNVLTFELFIRSHHAVIDITYTKDSYSIEYVDSTNLKAKGNRIHRNYNNWIRYLSLEIDSRIRQLK